MTSLPTWEQLPQLELYLDQVLLFVNQTLEEAGIRSDKPLTASMINNYVKHTHLEKPVKKKYNRHHLARLIVLSLCKPVFAIPDIIAMIELLSKETSPAQLYNDFIAIYQGQATTSTPTVIAKACQTLQAYHDTLTLVQELQGDHYGS